LKYVALVHIVSEFASFEVLVGVRVLLSHLFTGVGASEVWNNGRIYRKINLCVEQQQIINLSK